MTPKDIKKREVLGFDEFIKAHETASKSVMLKAGENAHPGAHAMKGEDLFVKNDPNPYKAAGIPHDEKKADWNAKNMNANQVDVFVNGENLTKKEVKKLTDNFGGQVVVHHQAATIVDESTAMDFDKELIEKTIKKDDGE